LKDESQQRSISYLDPSGRLIGLNYGVLSHSHITVLAHTMINDKDAVLAVTYNDNLVDTSFTGPSKIGQLPGSVAYVSTDGGYVWEPTAFLSCSAIFDKLGICLTNPPPRCSVLWWQKNIRAIRWNSNQCSRQRKLVGNIYFDCGGRTGLFVHIVARPNTGRSGRLSSDAQHAGA